MYATSNWPDFNALPIPTVLAEEVRQHLIEAFTSEKNASEYWNTVPSLLIILDENDDRNTLEQQTDERLSQINFALKYPEFVIPIGTSHHLALAIFSDEGSGIYLLIHNDNTLTQELMNG